MKLKLSDTNRYTVKCRYDDYILLTTRLDFSSTFILQWKENFKIFL